MILRVIVILIIFSLCFTSMAKNGVSKKENIPFVMILYGGSALIAFSQFKNCDCQDEFPCAIQVFLYNCFRKN